MPTSPVCRGSAAASSLPCVKGGIVCTSPLRCHSEPVTDVTGVGIRAPRPQARNTPRLPLRGRQREAPERDVVRPHPRCSSVGGDAHIAPPRPQARNTPRLPLRGRQREAPERDVVRPHPRCSSVGGDAHIAPPRPQARNTPRLPLRGRQREAPERDVVRPHPRCSSVGGDAHIAPPFSHHIPGGQRRPPLHTF